MKTVLLVPGYKESIDSRDYAPVIESIEKRGYKVEFIVINWKRSSISNWVNELETAYAAHDPQQTILAGFSFGAMTAFTMATHRNPSELWLFSLSPYFHEDIHNKDMSKRWLKNIGQQRVADFDTLYFNNLAKNIRCKTLIFTGAIEMDQWPNMKRRALEAQKRIQKSRLFIIDNVGHDVSNRSYINAIKQAI